MSFMKLGASAIVLAAVSATAAMARDQVQVTGSSTVLPYATIVAEAFGENFDFPTPVVEGGGSGAGRAKMCEGVGRKHRRHRQLVLAHHAKGYRRLYGERRDRSDRSPLRL